jgi:hypothetical protein
MENKTEIMQYVFEKMQYISLLPKYFFFQMAQQPYWGQASSLLRLHDHTQTHHIRYDSSGRVTSPSQRPLPDNTQHSQQTDIHAAGGIQAHNPSKRAAADQRLRPRGHWDRQSLISNLYTSVASRSWCCEGCDFWELLRILLLLLLLLLYVRAVIV